ncbi:MAG TPA: hypothetical protein VG405_13780 [Solirubrobacteraceae bacterium]|jgi:hypothetical protein|nr:hypothetical protein [Solirubrobacteraceae bacterium]
MALLAWLWLVSPFALIGFISHDRELLAVVGAHPVRCRAIGWGGVALMLLGVAVVPGTPGWMMFLIGTPLAGLTVWGVRDDPDGGGGSPPDGPPIDWGDFERSFWAYVRRRDRRSPRPRVPSAR